MKVCYLIQSHKNPEQVVRLVRVIKKTSPMDYVLISHNFTSCNFVKTLVQDLEGVEVINCKNERGGFSLVQSYLDAVHWLISHNIEFDWMINLSGQDYPTQPLTLFKKSFAKTAYDGYFKYFEVLSEQSPWGIKNGYLRYFYQYFRLNGLLLPWQRGLLKPLVSLINYVQPFFKVDTSYGFRAGFHATRNPFNEEFLCYGGSYWKILSKKCVEFLYKFSNEHPELISYFSKTLNSDESFMQTILLNSRKFNFCNYNYWHVDFSHSQHGHPSVLTSQDYSVLTNNNVYFARKFDIARDSKILDMLDAKILQNT